MKKLVIILALFLIPSVAQAWRAFAEVEVRPFRVSASFYNRTDRPMYCEGSVFGQLQSGHTLDAWANGLVYPGHYGYWYVYSNNPNNQFVNGWSEVYCNWVQ